MYDISDFAAPRKVNELALPTRPGLGTESHDISFHQVHAKDGGRIKYQRVCTECGEVVPYQEIDKAYDSEDGERVVLTDEDFEKLPAAEKHEIPVLQFVPTEQIDPILFEKSYYLEPDSSSPKAYGLLAATLEQSDRTALVHFTLRQRTRRRGIRAADASDARCSVRFDGMTRPCDGA